MSRKSVKELWEEKQRKKKRDAPSTPEQQFLQAWTVFEAECPETGKIQKLAIALPPIDIGDGN